MRRDYFTISLQNVGDGDESPGLCIEFDGPSESLDERLTGEETAIDVAFRLQTGVDADDATGVFSLADRVTGEFLLEVNAEAATVFDLVDAARDHGQSTSDAEGCFSIELREDGEQVFEQNQRILLVYDQDGSLLRHESLIPSGVEL